MHNRTKLLVAFAATMAAVAGCESSTEVDSNLHFAGILNAAKVKPTAPTATGTGQALVVVNSSGTLSYSVTWTGLTGTVTGGAHIHGPADSASVGGTLLNFQALPVGSANQSMTTTAAGAASGNVDVKAAAVITAGVSGDSLVKLLNAGLLYVDVHTTANAGGEIRAQLKKQ
jgi:hypothetical protein